MPKSVRTSVERAIRGKVFPGCVIGIVRKSGERDVEPFGNLRYGGDPVARDTIYDVASLTKSMPTASLALSLIENGSLRLSGRVRDHIAGLENDHGATIEDLLRYRVRGKPMSRLASLDAAELKKRVLAGGFVGPAGAPHYTNLPAFLLGLVIEQVLEQPINDAAAEYFFAPLGMFRTFFVEPFPKHECAPTEIDESGEVHATPHDESARVLGKGNVAAGHAGLFSTAPDILNFLEALLDGRLMNVAEDAEKELGWQVNEPYFMGSHAGAKTFGKTGYTGTSVVIDRESDIAFVILSNRTYPRRPPHDDAINKFRRDIADIIFSAYH